MAKSTFMTGFLAGGAMVVGLFALRLIRLKYHPPFGALGYTGPDPWLSKDGAIKLYLHWLDYEKAQAAKAASQGGWPDQWGP